MTYQYLHVISNFVWSNRTENYTSSHTLFKFDKTMFKAEHTLFSSLKRFSCSVAGRCQLLHSTARSIYIECVLARQNENRYWDDENRQAT